MPVNGPERGVPNKRYYFPVIGDGGIFDDERGMVLSGPEMAKLHAAAIAAELARDGADYRGFVVCAVDIEGNEVARVPVAPVLEEDAC